VINLPTVVPIPTTSGLTSPSLYSFHVPTVGPSSGVTFIDPVVATGFIYTIGAGNPNFASVDPVTNVGSGIYQLLVLEGGQFVLVDPTLAAGQTFNFRGMPASLSRMRSARAMTLPICARPTKPSCTVATISGSRL
jgi:hypothetical protein